MAQSRQQAGGREDEEQRSVELHQLLAKSIGPACHELRSPLAVVYGFARMLEGSKTLDDTSRRYVEHVVSGAQRLDEMLDSLSSLGRIAAGRVSPSIERVPVRDLVAHGIEEAGVAGRVHLLGGEDVVVEVDREWASEAIGNLASAMAYDEGIAVRVAWSQRDGIAHVELRADGELPLPNVEVGHASLKVALARMRAEALGGSLEPVEGGADLRLPRPAAG